MAAGRRHPLALPRGSVSPRELPGGSWSGAICASSAAAAAATKGQTPSVVSATAVHPPSPPCATASSDAGGIELCSGEAAGVVTAAEAAAVGCTATGGGMAAEAATATARTAAARATASLPSTHRWPAHRVSASSNQRESEVGR